MNRILSIAILMLVTASGFAMDRFNQDPPQTPIATTGRILRVDLKSRTLKVRSSESQARLTPDIIKESLWQRISGKVPSVRMPSIAILLTGRSARNSSVRLGPDGANVGPNEFFVLTNDDTIYQDGVDPLHLEDFHAGETISIHGMLTGSTLHASRIAKWD